MHLHKRTREAYYAYYHHILYKETNTQEAKRQPKAEPPNTVTLDNIINIKDDGSNISLTE